MSGQALSAFQMNQSAAFTVACDVPLCQDNLSGWLWPSITLPHKTFLKWPHLLWYYFSKCKPWVTPIRIGICSLKKGPINLHLTSSLGDGLRAENPPALKVWFHLLLILSLSQEHRFCPTPLSPFKVVAVAPSPPFLYFLGSNLSCCHSKYCDAS